MEQEVPVLLGNLLRMYDPAWSDDDSPEIVGLEIGGIQEDSRRCRPGDLFIARPAFGSSSKTDLCSHVRDAQKRGAVAVVTTQYLPDLPLPQIVLNDSAASSILANLFHGRPSETMSPLGVTGTNGKTTTAYLIRHLLRSVGRKCGMIGTVEIDDGNSLTEASMTTPDAITLANLLATMRANGCMACAMEVSSHALHQKRVAGIRFAGAGFTNLTGDHLDYHGTMDAYASAKAELFKSLEAGAVATINMDDASADRMVRDCSARVIRYSARGTAGAQYVAQHPSITAQGTRFILDAPSGRADVSMTLIGRHNIENALCAASLVGEAFGLTAQQIATGLADAAGAPGRLQTVRCGQPFAVLVDYAHTDDALRNVLTALRSVARGKLRVLFGCGGDRDRTKRPRMANIANQFADAVYITSDNPRTESPAAILDEIRTGLPASNRCVLIEEDRRAAIEKILADAEPEDVVLIAGKGHENYQIVGTTKHHFDDVEECARVLGSAA
ncbi:MAG: UDP-N-acetylmuramoyl-L-alanyl-D-glutamate--2,6-diaminopimelate ligase [Phycisphaerae bacterium]|nr:UDP-N-acetylmuramoyl-L-alanyl-D-glutamate--2,6-diaminopimelate ligase [Phycisphaerae bacterium]